MATQNRVAEQFRAIEDQTKDAVVSHPIATVATAFGLGLVAGIVTTIWLRSPAPSMAERMGHRLVDTIAQMAPPSWLR